MVSLTITMLLVLAYSVMGDNTSVSESTPNDSFSKYHESKMPELEYYKSYESLRDTSNSVVVYPIFTQSAYQWSGMHDYYTGRCDDSCLTISIQDHYKKSFASSTNAYRILEFLDYEIIDDIDLDQNPSLLKKYDKVILLHNEFVTKAEFEAIIEHPNVIYLYPHALTSEVKTDYEENTITLLRGPGYPDESIINGFDWKFDNSQYFDDWSCNEWEFYKIDNGHMLNCYPETELPHYGHDILKAIKSL